MAMSGDILGKAIADAIVDRGTSTEGKAQCEAFWKKIANKIVLHIQQNAQVNSGIPVSIAGGDAAQTGSTTEPGTIS